MKKQILYGAILILPFISMILLNEFVRYRSINEGFSNQGITTINSAKKLKEECSWICHNNTNYCKENHVNFANTYFDKIDPIYFGIINSLKSTGNYRWANVIFLVILLPLIMYILLVRSIDIQFKIRELKKK